MALSWAANTTQFCYNVCICVCLRERENADNFAKGADNLLKSTWDAAAPRVKVFNVAAAQIEVHHVHSDLHQSVLLINVRSRFYACLD